MSKLVLLKLGDGSFEQGFPVALQFGEEGHHPTVETIGRLPPAIQLQQAYQSWAAAYRRLNQRLRLEAETYQIPNVSKREDCYDAARELVDCLNTWLYADSFRPIREKLLERLMTSDRVRVIVQTEHPGVRRLPWHLWDFCDRYPKSEIALGASVYERIDSTQVAKSNVNVLAILGNSDGIDTQTDRRLLEYLPGAKVSFLVEPTRQELTQELWRQSWDILFFAGHSCSLPEGSPGNRGQIALNQTDSLTLDQLKYALRRAVERGLQVAIFNSCDGLGLARELEDLRIPQIIVMREPVPDRVAQEFLKSFLAAFAQGETFYLAVRQARETLQGIEDEYPCATWLPVICQNPAVIPPTWQALGGDLLTLPAPDLATQDAVAMMRTMMNPVSNPKPISPKPTAPEVIGQQLTGPQLTGPQPTNSVPTGLINDRYQVQRMLGQGGFGRTFLAADTYRFGDLCVLKQFAPANLTPQIVQRSRELFEREAKVLYQINHPQIPKFLAWFTQNDQLFIVEEFIDGKTYLALLEERRQQSRTFSEVEIIQWLKDLLPVIDYLHGMNIIHRDISPGNVILPEHRSQPVLIDFGIVKEVASQIWSGHMGSLQEAIQQASRVGKPGYAPPEQMQLGQCYPCSDIYALAMTAIVLHTGRSPQWLLEQRRLLEHALPQMQRQGQIQLSDGFRQILNKMLAENPRNRYQTAQAVLADLQLLSPSLTSYPPDEFTVEPVETISLSPQFLEQCQTELVRCIGPMARYLIEDILAQQPQLTSAELVERLAEEIPDVQQAMQFKKRVKALQQPIADLPPKATPERKSVPKINSGVNPVTASRSPASPTDLLTAPLNPSFLDRCRRELARQIGPMAHCIIDDILAQSPQINTRQFINAVVDEIPDLQQAEKVRQQLMAQLRT